VSLKPKKLRQKRKQKKSAKNNKRPIVKSYKKFSERKRYLFHGTSSTENFPFDNGISPQFKEQSKDYTDSMKKEFLDQFHGVDLPAVWLSDRVGAAQFYASDYRSGYGKEGWVYVIDISKLKDDRIYYGDYGGDYHDAEGDLFPHTEYAFVSKIPAIAVVASANACLEKDLQYLRDTYEY